MPTYDYVCESCGEMEIYQSIKDDTLTKCPECGSKKFQKQLSMGAGVIFKGDGFWETDYNRSSDYKEKAKAESSGSSSKSSGPSTASASSSDTSSSKSSSSESK